VIASNGMLTSAPAPASAILGALSDGIRTLRSQAGMRG
jgi:hypothetical protein